MNKKIEDFFNQYGSFSYNGIYAYGEIAGYEVNIIKDPTQNGPMLFFSTNLSDSKKELFISKMKSYKISMLKPFYFNYGVFVLVGALTMNKFMEKFPDVLDKVLSTLEELEAPKKDICPETGMELTSENSKIANFKDPDLKIRLINGVIDDFNVEIDKMNEEYKNAPNNYFKGFLGILIGGIVGVVATYIFSLIGFISAISSIISIFLGIFLYKKFGGKPNWVMIVMSLSFTFISIAGFIFFLYLTYANVVCAANEINLSGIAAFKYCLGNVDEFSKEFTKEILIHSLFIVIGAAVSIFSLIRSIKRPTNIGS